MQTTSFNKGYRQIAPKDRERFIARVKKALGVDSVQSFYDYKKGSRELKFTKAKAIEKIFASFGITEVWGKK
jgi:hypothetical protein